MGDTTVKKPTSKEEEMLEQTFGNYDTDLSTDPSSPLNNETGSDTVSKKNNMFTYGIFGVGIIAVIMVIYNFILPMFLSTPKKNVQNNVGSNVGVGVNNNANNAITSTPMPNSNLPGVVPGNVPGVVPGSVVVSAGGNPGGIGPQGPQNSPNSIDGQPNDPNLAAVSGFLTNQQSNGASPVGLSSATVSLNLPTVTPDNSSNGNNSTTNTVTVATSNQNSANNSGNGKNNAAVKNQAVTVAVNDSKPTTVTVESSGGNSNNNQNTSSALLDSMKVYFDKQFSDVKSDISRFNRDIEKQSQATSALTSTVRDIDSRLKKLEEGGGISRMADRGRNKVDRVAINNESVEVVTPSVKKHSAHTKRLVSLKSKENNLSINNQSPITTTMITTTTNINKGVINSVGGEEQVLIVSKPDVRTISVMKEKEKLMKDVWITKYKIHSLYAGRIWIANMDNTHSNYSVGDTLPEGEIIKEVDMEKGIITTDRGRIKAY